MATQPTVAPELLLSITSIGITGPPGHSILWKASRPDDPSHSCLILVSKVSCAPEHQKAFNAEMNAEPPLSIHDLMAMIP